MTLTDKEFIKLVKTNRENEDVESDGFKGIGKALDDGANINSYDESSGNPLHIAAKFGNIPLMTLLLEKGADINHNKPGIYNRMLTPLYHVINEIQLAQRNGLAPITATGIWNAKTEEGRIQQREEAEKKIKELRDKRVEAVKFLLSKGADVKKENYEWKQPVEDTAYNKYYNLTELLLKHGADPRSILDYSTYIENNHTTMDDRMLKLLMEYAIRDPNYKPNDKAHQRVKDMFTFYKQQKEEKDNIIDDVADKNKVSEDVSKQMKTFIDGSGKRKSRKTKAKKSKKVKTAKKLRKPNKIMKKRITRKDK